MAMGINQIAALAGQFIGLLAGGILAAINWRAVFLASVPFAIGGAVWAYLMLHETATIRKNQRLDLPGNILFALGLTILLVGLTYGLEPYGNSTMGWGSPFVLASVIGGVALLAVFVWVELRSPEPMFRIDLFKIRMFTAGNAANFLAALARGGLSFLLIIWLQGIWLPLHGYSFEDTPLWAGIYMLPLTGGFLLMGPLSGWLSDRYGARWFSTGGMLLTAVCFVGLMLLPVNFAYGLFAVLLLLMGMGMGMFAAPNTTAIMNAVPPEHRGVASGMRATFMNAANTLSITLIFTLVIIGLAQSLPSTLLNGLTAVGVPAAAAQQVANLPPTGALFAAFLGYNPMGTLLPPPVLAAMPAASQALVLGKTFFPQLISAPFQQGLRVAFVLSTVLSLLAAFSSLLLGQRVIYGQDLEAASAVEASSMAE